MQYSINKEAEEIVWLRDIPNNTIIFDFPCELDYHCPVCKYKLVTDWNYDTRLDWSEYNYMIWCRKCETEYFSFFCLKDITKQQEIAFTVIKDIKRDFKNN
jgi:hypothetical protein